VVNPLYFNISSLLVLFNSQIYIGGYATMFHKLKVFYNNQTIKWLGRFLYYLLILLLLFFMFGFNDASAGSYIYNDF
jgi:hypothetical protein